RYGRDGGGHGTSKRVGCLENTVGEKLVLEPASEPAHRGERTCAAVVSQGVAVSGVREPVEFEVIVGRVEFVEGRGDRVERHRFVVRGEKEQWFHGERDGTDSPERAQPDACSGEHVRVLL